MSFTADAGTPSVPLAHLKPPSVPLAHLKRHKMAQGGSYKGSATGEAQWLISPRTTGWGITVSLLPPPCQTPLDNRSTSWEDGRVKRRAAAGSLALWRTCHNANMERDGGTQSPTSPQTPSSGDPRPAVGQSADISVIFLVSYRGRLKRPHLHCRAKAVVLLVISTRWQKHLLPLPPTT